MDFIGIILVLIICYTYRDKLRAAIWALWMFLYDIFGRG